MLDECDRDLGELVPEETALKALRRSLKQAVDRAIEFVEGPNSLTPIPGTDPKDVIHLTYAVAYNCDFLVTYNVSDYPTKHAGVTVIESGTLMRRIREQIGNLS